MSIAAVETYFNTLITNKSLPKFFGEVNGIHDIKRIETTHWNYKGRIGTRSTTNTTRSGNSETNKKSTKKTMET